MRLLPRTNARPRLRGGRVLLSHACLESGELRVNWLDEPPGRLVPAEGQLLAIDEQIGGGWEPVAWDDQDDVVVRAVGGARAPGKKGFGWSVTISRSGLFGKTLRLRLLPGHGQPEYLSEPFPGCRR
jgi:hypothetical protein